MPVIGLIGCQGSGKTLSLVREILIDYNNGMKIYSNIKLNGIEHSILNLKWFKGYLLEKKGMDNVVVVIDELQLYADCREHKKTVNKILSYFALQTRKRNVKLYFTTQYLENIDKRIRRCALDDMIIMCEGNYKFNKGKKKLISIKQSILYRYKVFNRLINHPDKYYQFYNTGEVLSILEDD